MAIQVGVVGYGLSAKVFQIPFLLANPRFSLRAIVHRSGTQAQEDHPGCVVYRSVEELVKDPAISLVVVSTPPQTHFEQVSLALQAGKNVVVEKPFAPTAAECNTLIALAQEHNVLLSVFQNRRWDADFVTLQHILQDGLLGRVVEFASHFDRNDPDVPSSWSGEAPPGTGVVYDLGTHLIDQSLVLYGLPAKVTGFLATQRRDARGREQGLLDACTVLLHYASGLLVTVKASAVSLDTEQLRFWVRGDQGSFKKYHLDPQEPQIVDGMKLDDPAFGHEDASHAGTLTVSKGGKLTRTVYPTLPPVTYSRYYDLLAAALEGKGQVPVTPESARDTIHIIELAIQSSKEGVTLPVKPFV